MKKHKNIMLFHSQEAIPFSAIRQGGDLKGKIPERDIYAHAHYLEKQFEEAWKRAENLSTDVLAYSSRDGIYLEFRGKQEYELITRSLEDIRKNVRLCNIREIENTKHATVFIPNSERNFLLNKINNYKFKDKNKNLVNSIECINSALVEALWTDKRPIPSINREDCEVWLSIYHQDEQQKIIDAFFELCEQLQLSYSKNFIGFPERVVIGVKANKKDLTDILANCSNIAEFRRLLTPSSFYTGEHSKSKQKEWIENLLKRASFKENTNVFVCLLDKGVSNGHPLLEPVLKDSDMHTYFNDGIVQDISHDGHGTGMAGIATYFNLEELLENDGPFEVNHRLESVRIVDDRIANKPDLYGYITSSAISFTEISNPNTQKVITMPITAKHEQDVDVNDATKFKGDGAPTSWSASIDNLALGNYEFENSEHRLIIISAGNTSEHEIETCDDYELAVVLHSVEDPGQSWNALTIGAYTEKVSLARDKDYADYAPLVEAGSYSPFTSSSLIWDNQWPIKPDIVLEGGNIGYNASASAIKYSALDSLSLLTTNNNFHHGNYFTTLAMTSSATAQAAYMAARIYDAYPGLWPETVRALLVHSASWTDAMIRQVFGKKRIEQTTKKERGRLLRLVGYGLPDLDRALYSLNNSVNLIIEDEIQPFIKSVSSSQISMNEMALHEIPWPKDVLIGLGDTPINMRVTLSYFIDPAPGEIGWKDKYRYPGCRLYFEVNSTNEDKSSFLARINRKIKEKENNIKIYENTSGRWFLGAKNRNTGSIHSDIWEDTAVNLAENRYLAVYPGGGWWKDRTNLHKYHTKIKYSLVISISTPKQSIDLYSPITNTIKQAISKEKVETKIVIKNN